MAFGVMLIFVQKKWVCVLRWLQFIMVLFIMYKKGVVWMIKILICDDDRAFAQQQEASIAAILERMELRYAIHCFSGGEPVSEAVLGQCDLAFLDIDFPRERYNGIDIARQLRQCNQEAVIVFVTNFVEYAPEGYEVQALRYLLKGEVSEKLEPCLHLALKRLQDRRRTFSVQIGGDTLHLPIEELVYIESCKHTCLAYVREEDGIRTYSFYAALRKVEEALADCGFLRVQKSFLVNMRHILRYQCREVVLTGEITLPVSPKTYAEQKRKYLFWKGRQ